MNTNDDLVADLQLRDVSTKCGGRWLEDAQAGTVLHDTFEAGEASVEHAIHRESSVSIVQEGGSSKGGFALSYRNITHKLKLKHENKKNNGSTARVES